MLDASNRCEVQAGNADDAAEPPLQGPMAEIEVMSVASLVIRELVLAQRARDAATGAVAAKASRAGRRGTPACAPVPPSARADARLPMIQGRAVPDIRCVATAHLVALSMHGASSAEMHLIRRRATRHGLDVRAVLGTIAAPAFLLEHGAV